MFPLVGYVLLFLAVGVAFIVVNLLVGKLVRPARPQAEKATIYECGEPTIGSAWVQFDLRFYVVALLFVIFDVEVAFFFPWAVVFGNANSVAHQTDRESITADETKEADYRNAVKALAPNSTPVSDELTDRQVKDNAQAAHALAWFALFDILVFFGVLLVGFAYLWKRGDLQWVKAVTSDTAPPLRGVQQPAPTAAS